MDELAAEVGVDPLEIREKNWIKHEEFPFTTVAGLEYDSGNYEAATAQGQGDVRVRRAAGRAEAAPRRPATRSSSASASRRSPRCAAWRRPGCSARSTTAPAAGSTRACGCWPPARSRSSPAPPPTARATRRRSARSSPTGSACAFEDVEVLHGDTQIAHKGLDTYGSRSLVVGGEALVRAADKVIEKAKPIAAHLLEASRRRPRVRRRPVLASGAPTRAWRSARSRLAAFAAHNLPDGVEPTLDSEATYDPVNFNFPHGTHLCAMEVDTETGAVKMRKYVCVDDIGNIINPLIVAGQVHGGLVQGIAQALWEEAVYDDSGTLVSGSFVDYLLPTAADTISFDIDHTTIAGDRPTRSAPRASARPAPSPRPRPWSTRSSTPSATSASTTSRCRARPSGCGGRSTAPAPAAPPRARRCRTSTPTEPGTDRARKERAHDPRTVRLRGARPRSRRRWPRSPSTATTPRSSPAGRACCRCCGCGSTPPRWSSTSAGSTSLRGVRDDGDAIVIGAMTTARRRSAPTRWSPSTPLLSPRRSSTSPTPRSGTAAPSAARSRTPTRPATSGAPALALGAEFVIAGSGRHPHGGGRRLLRRPLRDRDRRGRDPHRGPDPQAHRLGRALREVRPGRPPVADRRGRRDRPGRRRHDRRGAGRADQHGLHAAAGAARSRRRWPGSRRPTTAYAPRPAQAAEGTNPPSDLNGDADYRRHLATVLTRRAVLAAAGG